MPESPAVGVVRAPVDVSGGRPARLMMPSAGPLLQKSLALVLKHLARMRLFRESVKTMFPFQLTLMSVG